MADARLEVEVNGSKFAAEGSEKWVQDQWAKISPLLSETTENRVDSASHQKAKAQHPATNTNTRATGTSLATFLREKAIGDNQVRRFLAAAVWLANSGVETLKSSDVAKALVDAHQKKIGNPADTLNQNVTKGFCVKHGDGFYVTPEGEESLIK